MKYFFFQFSLNKCSSSLRVSSASLSPELTVCAMSKKSVRVFFSFVRYSWTRPKSILNCNGDELSPRRSETIPLTYIPLWFSMPIYCSITLQNASQLLHKAMSANNALVVNIRWEFFFIVIVAGKREKTRVVRSIKDTTQLTLYGR